MKTIGCDSGAIIRELTPAPGSVDAFRCLSGLPHCLFLDSAMRHPTRGRYSFVAADPFDFITAPADGTDALPRLRAALNGLATPAHPDLPPFQGGAAGLFGYDLNRGLETLAAPRHDEFQVPALAIGLYDVVIAFDHAENRAWVISQGLPEHDPARRARRAERRMRQFLGYLRQPRADASPGGAPRFATVPAEDLATQYPVSADGRLTSTFSAPMFRATIQRVIDYIYAGDIFQVNIAQRLLCAAVENPLAIYLKLRRCNAAPFAAYFDLGRYQILSASPERFVSVRDRAVETRPIKGTGPRCGSPEADLFAGQTLRASAKDRAENIMIVDLLRNDLARVCAPASVRVTKLCGLEQYQFIQHLVSVVHGRLAPGHGVLDLIAAAFPGGSITGAPKIRAMEIIAALEPTARGAYCGCLGYVGFNETCDLNILIRTITAGAGWLQLPVGGGIVAQSVPEREYEETW